ncbi:MAG: DUF4998 domain-containing protein [Cyclobacteriaceae bacterium]
MKIMLIRFLAVFLILLSIHSCETQEDTIKEFVSNGEGVTVGAVQKVFVGLGINKLQLDVVVNADPRVANLLIFEEDLVHEFEIVRSADGYDTLTYLLSLEDRLYNFNLLVEDIDGNLSLPYELVVSVPGTDYISTLSTRRVTSFDYDRSKEGMVLNFGSVFSNMLETFVTYASRGGFENTIILSNDSTSLIIDDYRAEGDLVVISSYQPILKGDETSFEDFYALDTIKLVFPACEELASINTSTTFIDFGEVQSATTSEIKSFTLQSDDCLFDDINLLVNAPYSISKTGVGNWSTSLDFNDISVPQNIFVRMRPTTIVNDEIIQDVITFTAGNLTSAAETQVSLRGRVKF